MPSVSYAIAVLLVLAAIVSLVVGVVGFAIGLVFDLMGLVLEVLPFAVIALVAAFFLQGGRVTRGDNGSLTIRLPESWPKI
ncbi:hypothetical protein [uncultured Parolsenella sp.]|mgnify:CR=1 FL=1|uniref:hypothetical protein n=1 Tax=uncultured Parolsenella sp. TaxID=2083008 RepID=UPI0025DF8278|nr:hypothetical protein [uncultured Parolsenella sp.]